MWDRLSSLPNKNLRSLLIVRLEADDKNSNDPNKKSTDNNFHVFCFGHWKIEDLGFVSNFDIRILDFFS